LTRDEEWDNDLNSHVGNTLRQTNPARFPNRHAVKDFLAMAIENKIGTENGDGALKMLTFTAAESRSTMPVSDRPPISIDEMPEKALTMASSLPFVLFVKWYLCPRDCHII
jgi:hypothetical protein